MRLLLNWLSDWWKGRYTLYLEQENAQLKADLRDITNSLLTAQGMPTIGPREVRRSTRVPINRFAIPSQARRRNEQFVRDQIRELEAKDGAAKLS